jgi:HEPN domain-containing protein
VSRIRDLQEQLERSYSQRDSASIDVPLPIQTLSLISYAQDYLRAAACLAAQEGPATLPLLQLTGQAVELALKGCLASAGKKPPRNHDLLTLYEFAETEGFCLKDDSQLACLVHLHHWFSQDLATNTKYKSRYPPTSTEAVGGAVPSHSAFAEIISSLCEQARLRVPYLWPPQRRFAGNPVANG